MLRGRPGLPRPPSSSIRSSLIGPAPAAESYLSVERIVAAALYAGCDAIHPGYGFLSERPELPEACAENGIAFVGPPGEVMRRSGDKLAARDLAAKLGIPTGGGTDALPDGPAAEKAAAELDDFPLIMKASAGGGGRGMRIVRSLAGIGPAFDSATRGGGARLRRRAGLPRALRRERPPRRGADPRRRARHRAPPGRARLLHPAPAPEADRGGPGRGPGPELVDAHPRVGRPALPRTRATSAPAPWSFSSTSTARTSCSSS